MKEILRWSIFAVSGLLWISAWGWLATVVVAGGYQLMAFILPRLNNKTLAWILVVGILVLALTFFIGGPVAAWIVWSPVQGVIYGIITLVAAVKLLLDDARTPPVLSGDSSEL